MRAEALVAELGAVLSAQGWMAATAESCTGGMVASRIVDSAGASGWFERGFVTYSNDAKTELLGVPEETLAAHGAVSEETARAMAQGAVARSRAQCAVSTTGIAGPGGAAPGKPVGTVCFGAAVEGWGCRAATVHFEGDRRAVREQAAAYALGMLLSCVKEALGK